MLPCKENNTKREGGAKNTNYCFQNYQMSAMWSSLSLESHNMFTMWRNSKRKRRRKNTEITGNMVFYNKPYFLFYCSITILVVIVCSNNRKFRGTRHYGSVILEMFKYVERQVYHAAESAWQRLCYLVLAGSLLFPRPPPLSPTS